MATNLSRNSSWIFACRYMRSLQVHTEPPKKNFEVDRRVDRLVDVGVLHDDERRLAAELEPDRLDALGAERVDLAARAHAAGHRDEVGVLVRRRDARRRVRPSPVTTLRTPSGMPARRQSSPSTSVASGVSSCGLTTIVLPVTSAGPTLRANSAAGKIPGGDAGDDAVGHALNPDLLVAALARQDLALQPARAFGGVAQQRRAEGRRRCATPADQLAALGGEESARASRCSRRSGLASLCR